MKPPSRGPAWAFVAVGLWVSGGAAALLGGCNGLLGNDAWTLAPDASPLDAGQTDDAREAVDTGSPSVPDTGALPDSSSPPPPVDSSIPPDTAPPPAPDTGPALAAGLVLPPSSGDVCEVSEGDSVCTSEGETCRISSATEGRCDTFPQGHEGTFPCEVDSDCDDTLQCYNGECHVLCPLGESCAGGCECLDVGNETTGICCPGG